MRRKYAFLGILAAGCFAAAVLAFEMWKRSFLDNSFGIGAAIASVLMLHFVPFLVYQVRSQRKNN